MRIRHHFPRVPAPRTAEEMPYTTIFLCFLSLLSSLSIHKTCLLQQRLPATCHPNANTKATCPPNPNTTQADESSSLNKAYHQSGEMRGFSWAGKRKCVQVSRRGPFHGLYVDPMPDLLSLLGGGVSFQIHRPEKMVLIIDSHTDNEIQPEL